MVSYPVETSAAQILRKIMPSSVSQMLTEVELSMEIQISLVLAGKSTVCTAICSSSGSGAIIAAASGVAVTRMSQTWLPNIRSRLNAALISARWVKP